MRSTQIGSFFIILFSFLIICCSSSDNEDDILSNPDTGDMTDDDTSIINLSAESGTTLDFGQLVINNSLTKVLTVGNSGNSNLIISGVSLPDGYSTNFESIIISPNEQREVTVAFTPTDMAEFNGIVDFTTNATSGNSSIGISGIGISEIFEGSIALRNQQEVNDFAAIGYTSITEVLTIGDPPFAVDTDIEDLSWLNGLIQAGSLVVRRNPILENLDGLENLNVTTRIQIAVNNSL